MLNKRIATAFVLGGLGIFVIVGLQTPVFGLCLALVLCLSAWEWGKLSGLGLWEQRVYPLLFIGLFGYLYYAKCCLSLLVGIGILWWCIGVFLLLQYQKKQIFLLRAHWSRAGIGLFVLLPMSAALLFLHGTDVIGGNTGRYSLLFLIVLISFVDSGAYFCGRKWGHRALACHISPGKSWAGLWGGLASGMLVTMIYIGIVGFTLVDGLIFTALSVITMLFSVVGDLMESVIKRLGKAKDSGTILPGHGGILDRIDSLSAAAPIFLGGLLLTDLPS